jgi:hypothetical protein
LGCNVYWLLFIRWQYRDAKAQKECRNKSLLNSLLVLFNYYFICSVITVYSFLNR